MPWKMNEPAGVLLAWDSGGDTVVVVDGLESVVDVEVVVVTVLVLFVTVVVGVVVVVVIVVVVVAVVVVLAVVVVVVDVDWGFVEEVVISGLISCKRNYSKYYSSCDSVTGFLIDRRYLYFGIEL